MRYPPIDADIILQIYEQNGTLMASDVEMYLKKRRGKNRFLPASSIEKMKLFEILALFHRKSEEEDNENIIGMIWEACRFLSKFDDNHAPDPTDFVSRPFYTIGSRKYWKLRLATFYTTLRRWELLIATSGYGRAF